jgi:hypothetical protein
MPETRARAAGEFPKRVILIYHPVGTELTQWRPLGSERDFGFSDTHGPGYVLAPLAPYREELLILDGIDHEAIAPRERRGQGHLGISTVWTGREVPSGPFEEQGYGWATGPSVDQYIASRIGGETAFASMVLGTYGAFVGERGPFNVAHYRGADQPVQPITNPAEAFERLFGGRDVDLEQAAARRRRRESILDTVRGEVGRLRNQLPSADRERMDAHLEGVRLIEERLSRLDAACATPVPPGDYTTSQQRESRLYPEISALHMETLVHAFKCDLTRVGCLQWGGEAPYVSGEALEGTGYDTFGGMHPLSHNMTYGWGDREATEAEKLVARDHMADFNRFRSELIARNLLDRLASEPEGDGTMLDNTLIVWTSSMSEGGSHSNRNAPVVIVQGRNVDYFETGRYLKWGDFDPVNATNGYNRYHGGVPMNKVLVSICQAMGLDDVTSFGEPDIEAGPLTEAMR